MKFMRKNYPEIINSAHAKFGSVVSPEDSREDEAVPDDQLCLPLQLPLVINSSF